MVGSQAYSGDWLGIQPVGILSGEHGQRSTSKASSPGLPGCQQLWWHYQISSPCPLLHLLTQSSSPPRVLSEQSV